MLQTLFFHSRISYVVQVVPLAVAAGLGWLVLHRREGLSARLVLRSLFAGYAAALAGIVLVPVNFWNNFYHLLFYGSFGTAQMELFQLTVNLKPTLLLVALGRHTVGSWGWFMMGANALLLVPFGVLHPLAWPGKHTMKTGMLTIFAIECLQPLVGRSFDVDDLICNGIGLAVGYALSRLFKT